MPDKRRHRGAHPEDRYSFEASALPTLNRAVHDLSWLLTHGYADKSANKLVGDRYSLMQRQRMAVMRCSCSDQSQANRHKHQLSTSAIRNRELAIDGYNVLTTIEVALSQGVVLHARDGCFRDIASMHGTFRQVAETGPALALLGTVLADLGLARCHWYLDRPVSNSGRLKKLMEQIASENGCPWEIDLVTSPDKVLSESVNTIATADSAILDRCHSWFNLAGYTIETHLRDAWVIRLDGKQG